MSQSLFLRLLHKLDLQILRINVGAPREEEIAYSTDLSNILLLHFSSWGKKLCIDKREGDTMTYENTSLQSHAIHPSSWSLGAIIRGYKIGITTHARSSHIPFGRQSRYHDRIIRDQDEYEMIDHYIRTNPARRHNDTFYWE